MWTLRGPKVNSLWRNRLLTLSNKVLTVHLTRTRVEPEKHILPSPYLQRKMSDPLNPKRKSSGTSLSILLKYAEVTPSHVSMKNLTRTIAMSSYAMLHCISCRLIRHSTIGKAFASEASTYSCTVWPLRRAERRHRAVLAILLRKHSRTKTTKDRLRAQVIRYVACVVERLKGSEEFLSLLGDVNSISFDLMVELWKRLD